MNKKYASTFLMIALAILLSACQFSVPIGQVSTARSTTVTPAPARPSPTPRNTPSPRPSATSAPTEAPFAGAEAVAAVYAAALTKGDIPAAADQLSSYGLMVANQTRGDYIARLKADGEKGRISGFKILNSQQGTPNTVLVHVSYTLGKDTSRDELWPFRFENEKWGYNFENLIDFHTLTVDPQTTNGITFIPLRLLRYSDHTRLELTGQNRTNEPVIFGQVNETLAIFHFGDKLVNAEKTYLALDAMRTTPGLALDAKGYFDTYPTSVDIRIWRDYQVKPWFSFILP